MSAAEAISQAEWAGIRFSLVDGRVRMEASAPPPPSVVTALRQYRDEVAELLSARQATCAPTKSIWPDGTDYVPVR